MTRQLQKLIRSQTDQRVIELATNTYRFVPDPLMEDQPAETRLRWHRLLVDAALRMPDHNFPHQQIEKERYLMAMTRFVAPLNRGESESFPMSKVTAILATRPTLVCGLLYGSFSERARALEQIPRSQDLSSPIELNTAQALEFKKIMARLIGNEFSFEEGLPNADESLLYRRSEDGVERLVQYVLGKIRNPVWLVRQDFLQGFLPGERHAPSLIKRQDQLAELIDQFKARHDDPGVWEATMRLREFARRQHQVDRDFRPVRIMMSVFIIVFLGYFFLFMGQVENTALLVGLGFFIFMPVTIMTFVMNYTHFRFAIHHVEQTRLDISDLRIRLGEDVD